VRHEVKKEHSSGEIYEKKNTKALNFADCMRENAGYSRLKTGQKRYLVFRKDTKLTFVSLQNQTNYTQTT